ncbi:hypothetical protein RIF29_29730 [Crotalaria pallida]|uniref:Uncharacterized protein n=1 Tax=Crotalaria pallida TaxID=3830 RepID=A0AAN9EF33_CROPI
MAKKRGRPSNQKHLSSSSPKSVSNKVIVKDTVPLDLSILDEQTLNSEALDALDNKQTEEEVLRIAEEKKAKELAKVMTDEGQSQPQEGMQKEDYQPQDKVVVLSEVESLKDNSENDWKRVTRQRAKGRNSSNNLGKPEHG